MLGSILFWFMVGIALYVCVYYMLMSIRRRERANAEWAERSITRLSGIGALASTPAEDLELSAKLYAKENAKTLRALRKAIGDAAKDVPMPIYRTAAERKEELQAELLTRQRDRRRDEAEKDAVPLPAAHERVRGIEALFDKAFDGTPIYFEWDVTDTPAAPAAGPGKKHHKKARRLARQAKRRNFVHSSEEDEQ